METRRVHGSIFKLLVPGKTGKVFHSLQMSTQVYCSRPCGVMVARLTTNQEVVVSSTTSVIFVFSADRFSLLDCNPPLCTSLRLDGQSLTATMNSYPLELLAQLAPVMFVAGLNPPKSPTSPPTSPTSPPINLASPSTPRPQDPFASLITRLRTTLSALRQASIWQSEKAKTFQVVLVDKVRGSNACLRYEFP